MVNLTEACQIILATHPNEYIHVVNEYENVFQFILLNKGEEVTDTTFVFWTPTINKIDGKCIEDVCGIEDVFQGEYTQYSRDEIESILGNSRKAS